MKIITTPIFKKRTLRTQWLYSQFNNLFLNGNILDVGCFEAPLKSLISERATYTGIDFVGNPDIIINLEKIKKLPFKKNQFETVICIEVLEHLENLHFLAKDLFRVSKKNVLISLPNCWRDARIKIQKGKGSFAHYGLPLNKPNDRHKWFFNSDDAIQYFNYIKPANFSLNIIITEPKRNIAIKLIRKIIYSKTSYRNKFCQTVWAEYKKIDL